MRNSLRFRFKLAVMSGIFMLLLLMRNVRQEDVFIVFDEISLQKNLNVSKSIEPESKPERLSYCDLWNQKVGKKMSCGKPFNSSWIPYLEMLNLSDKQISKMTNADDIRILSKDPIFVTAFSDNHLKAAIGGVIPAFKLLTKKFFVYDLGLNDSSLNQLRKIPEISIIKFNFSAYPAYVQKLLQFRWKPILIAEMLQKHEAIFYADAHYHLHKSTSRNWPQLIKKIRCQIDQSCSFYIYNQIILGPSYHSIFSATDERMYDFLPIDLTASKAVDTGSAGFQMVFATKDVRWNTMKWWLLCALEEECMDPKGTKRNCIFKNRNFWTQLADCHRQDQSAIAILLHNRNEYDERKHLVDFHSNDLRSRTVKKFPCGKE